MVANTSHNHHITSRPTRSSPRRRIPSNPIVSGSAGGSSPPTLHSHAALPYARRHSSASRAGSPPLPSSTFAFGSTSASNQDLTARSPSSAQDIVLDISDRVNDEDIEDVGTVYPYRRGSAAALVSGLLNKLPSLLQSATASRNAMWDYDGENPAAPKPGPSQPVHEGPLSLYLRSRETQSQTINRPTASSAKISWREPPSGLIDQVDAYTARRVPHLLLEREFDVSGLDKVFAAAWLSDSEVVMGTKCDRMFVLDTDLMKKIEIPTVHHTGMMNNVKVLSPSSSISSVSGSMSMIQQQLSNSNDENNNILNGQPVATPAINCCGIHAIAINPSKTLLAVGSGNPTAAIDVYQLPSFTPLVTLLGHSDMVFSVAWVSDNVLISGSRDMSVKSWTIPLESIYGPPPTITFAPNGQTILPFFPVIHPTLSRKEHRGKVRDLKHNPQQNQAATLSTDGFVKIWDASVLTPISSVPLYHTQETVCLAADTKRNLYAVGSQSHISLIDPRVGSLVHVLDSCDETWGVRSISMERDMVTVGGGLGRISFYDLRAQRYMDIGPSPSTRSIIMRPPRSSLRQPSSLASAGGMPQSLEDYSQTGIYLSRLVSQDVPRHVSFLQTGTGYLSRDLTWQSHFQGVEVRNAVYALCYDPSGARLFASGGPLQLNLAGCYAAIW
ncbi:hypothetical protein SmJEL517_g04738 [Synchytrium microbalum]|uniref:DDB1- and CUL4-associated factor 12 beta-propeller domain-containing protein n=1 Tax=Synchytrium microbalum TaxID=1806994 RepID=A0A507C3E8_9FUNG|nr:uncharacterized protein SmJEL517_g04738 [Synchytrium microbalum]TPX32075.1 hypothetical protein SmJEL517_g04738 [Synchytrium microbalum]